MRPDVKILTQSFLYIINVRITGLARLFFALFLYLVSIQGLSQDTNDPPLLKADDLPGAKFTSSRSFSGTSLFGYMNGGAELYLEYGLSDATINEIEYRGRKYKTEIYRMNGPEEAYGIFSDSKYRCLGMPQVGDYSCCTKYQLQFCKGDFYINIINTGGTRADSLASSEIGKIIAERIKGKEVELSGYLPDVERDKISSGAFLAKGRLGIVNGSPDLEDHFKGIRNFTAVVLKSEKNLLSVKFNDQASFMSFLELNGINPDLSSDSAVVRKISDMHLLIGFTR